MQAELNPRFQIKVCVHKGNVRVEADGRFRQRNHARRRLLTAFAGAIQDRQARRVACSGAVRLSENARLALSVFIWPSQSGQPASSAQPAGRDARDLELA